MTCSSQGIYVTPVTSPAFAHACNRAGTGSPAAYLMKTLRQYCPRGQSESPSPESLLAHWCPLPGKLLRLVSGVPEASNPNSSLCPDRRELATGCAWLCPGEGRVLGGSRGLAVWRVLSAFESFAWSHTTALAAEGIKFWDVKEGPQHKGCNWFESRKQFL